MPNPAAVLNSQVVSWWAQPRDLKALAITRMAIGTCVFMTALFWLPDAALWFSDRGMWPSETPSAGVARMLPQAMMTSSAWVAHLLLAGMLISGAAVAAGWRTKAASLLALVFLVVLQERSPLILHGGDTLLRALVLWLCLSPAGMVWSVDAALRSDASPIILKKPLWGGRMIEIQMSLMYAAATAWKLKGETWRNGEAAWTPAYLPDFARFLTPEDLLTPEVALMITWGTIVVELALATLPVLRGRLRRGVWACGIGLHLTIAATMRIELFPWICIAGLLIFLDERQVAWVEKRATGAAQKWGMMNRLARGYIAGLAVVLPAIFILLANEGKPSTLMLDQQALTAYHRDSAREAVLTRRRLTRKTTTTAYAVPAWSQGDSSAAARIDVYMRATDPMPDADVRKTLQDIISLASNGGDFQVNIYILSSDGATDTRYTADVACLVRSWGAKGINLILVKRITTFPGIQDCPTKEAMVEQAGHRFRSTGLDSTPAIEATGTGAMIKTIVTKKSQNPSLVEMLRNMAKISRQRQEKSPPPQVRD